MAKYNFDNVVMNLDKTFEDFIQNLDKEIDFYSFAPDEQDMLRVEIYGMFSQAIMNAIAFSLNRDDLVQAQNEIALSPYTNPLDIYLGYAANDPRIDEILSIELDLLLESLVALYRKI